MTLSNQMKSFKKPIINPDGAISIWQGPYSVFTDPFIFRTYFRALYPGQMEASLRLFAHSKLNVVKTPRNTIFRPVGFPNWFGE